MAPIRLPCLVGGECGFETVQLEYEQAKAQQDGHMQYAHGAAAGAGGGKKPEKFPRPEIKMDSSAEDWAEFGVEWEQYKEEYTLAGSALIRQLYACCSDELKQSLSRSTGGRQFAQTEANLLRLIKQLAVRYQNPAVHVQEFLGLSQQQDEGVRHYLTRLRGSASRCNFVENCSAPDCDSEVSYADSIIRFKLIAGLSDAEIKEDILSAEDKNLEETVKAIEANESGKLARKTVGASGPPSASKAAAVNTGATPRTCDYCGKSCGSSASASRSSREKNCPAWGKTCSNCKQKGHFAAVCRHQRRRKEVTVIEQEDSEDSVRLNSITLGEVAGLMYCVAKVNREVDRVNKRRVPHMLYEQLEWIVKHPPTQPCLRLSVNVDTRSYRDNKVKPLAAFKHRSADLEALADTGCQAVCMGRGQLPSLGLSVNDLMEVDLRLSGANGSGIRILGGVFITITGEDGSGKKWSTKQLCYVAEGITRLMLSKEACVQLGIINSSFPSVGSCYTASASAVTDSEEFDLVPCSPNEDGSCSCPRRETVPEAYPEFDPKLTAQQLRKKIIQHYAASAFNRCTRQTLPLMRGEPLPIPVRSGVRPTAVHTPVSVPLHW